MGQLHPQAWGPPHEVAVGTASGSIAGQFDSVPLIGKYTVPCRATDDHSAVLGAAAVAGGLLGCGQRAQACEDRRTYSDTTRVKSARQPHGASPVCFCAKLLQWLAHGPQPLALGPWWPAPPQEAPRFCRPSLSTLCGPKHRRTTQEMTGKSAN